VSIFGGPFGDTGSSLVKNFDGGTYDIGKALAGRAEFECWANWQRALGRFPIFDSHDIWTSPTPLRAGVYPDDLPDRLPGDPGFYRYWLASVGAHRRQVLDLVRRRQRQLP
jgi:hypothetical protein